MPDDDSRIEQLEEALRCILQWARAYPLDAFPEPDFAKAREVLTANGMKLDDISGHAMRHVLTEVAEIASRALGER